MAITVQTQGGLKLTEGDLSNLLVAQKNRIIWLIDNGFFSQARAAIDVVSELWRISDYAYKIPEVESRLSLAIRTKDIQPGDATPFPDGKIWSLEDILRREG